MTGQGEKVFYTKGGKALAQVAQRGGGCPVLGDTQGQAGRGPEHLMELWVSLFIAEGWNKQPLVVPSNTNHSMILRFCGYNLSINRLQK